MRQRPASNSHSHSLSLPLSPETKTSCKHSSASLPAQHRAGAVTGAVRTHSCASLNKKPRSLHACSRQRPGAFDVLEERAVRNEARRRQQVPRGVDERQLRGKLLSDERDAAERGGRDVQPVCPPQVRLLLCSPQKVHLCGGRG